MRSHTAATSRTPAHLNVALCEAGSPGARGSRHRQRTAHARSSASALLLPLCCKLLLFAAVVVLLQEGAAAMATSARSKGGAWCRKAVGSVRSRAAHRRRREAQVVPVHVWVKHNAA